MNVLYEVSIGRWLWDLYRNGPLRLGFWGGLGDAEVCARMAGNSNAADWVVCQGVVTHACEHMIRRSFQGLTVTIHLVMYVACVVVLLATLRQWVLAKVTAKTFAYEFYKLQAFGGTALTALPQHAQKKQHYYDKQTL